MMNAEPAFKIKTGNLHVLQLHIYTTDLDKVKAQLALRLSQTPDFFANTPVVLDLSAIAHSAEVLDLLALTLFMQAHGMCAAGIVGGSVEQRELGARAGLVLFSDIPARSASTRATDPSYSETGGHALPEQTELPRFAEALPADSAPQESIKIAPALQTTMVIDKPVRTGQRIYAAGGNLVVLAVVNAGAELIADGDIHVYAPMRGKAIAGAQGNENARIFVQCMEAELLSIAGCFKVFEEGVPENVRSKPAQVMLDGSKLLIQPLLY